MKGKSISNYDNELRHFSHGLTVLFWVEPMLVRIGPTFSWVIKHVQQLLNEADSNLTEGTIKIFCHPCYRSVIQKNLRNSDEKSNRCQVIFANEEESEKLDHVCSGKTWTWEHVTHWQSLLLEKGDAMAIQMDILNRVYEEYPFDVLVVWNASGAAKRFAHSKNLANFYIEMGPTRDPFPTTIQISPFGVNGETLIKYMPENHDFTAYKEKELLAYFSLDKMRPNKKEKGIIYKKYWEHGKKVVFIPLQIEDDTSFFMYAPKYNSMIDFLEDVVPTFIENGWVCLVKGHPGCSPESPNSRIVIDAQQRAKDWVLEKNSNQVVWLKEKIAKENYLNLLYDVDAVVTINSSVGFEAMICGTAVVAMGKPVYKTVFSQEEVIANPYNQQKLQMQYGIVCFCFKYMLIPLGSAFSAQLFFRVLYKLIYINDIFRQQGINGLLEQNTTLSEPYEYLLSSSVMPDENTKPRTIVNRGSGNMRSLLLRRLRKVVVWLRRKSRFCLYTVKKKVKVRANKDKASMKDK